MVVEAQREGALRECKENKPSNGAAGGREVLCRIQSFTGISVSLKVETIRVPVHDEVWKWALYW